MIRSLTKESFLAAFKACGLKAGDVLMLHIDGIVLSQLDPSLSFSQKCEILFDSIEEVLGPSGTLVIPTFTYSATKDITYDVDSSESQVGPVTEWFRINAGAKRTSDPIFSVAVKGALSEKIINAPYSDSFGQNSFFSVLQNTNAWLMCLGCPFTVTYLHYLEQSEKVPYRYLKRFIAKSAVSRGEVIEESIYYFVRNLELRNEIDWKGLRAYLYGNNILNKVPVGRVVLSGVKTEALDQAIRLLLNRNINGLLNLSDLMVE